MDELKTRNINEFVAAALEKHKELHVGHDCQNLAKLEDGIRAAFLGRTFKEGLGVQAALLKAIKPEIDQVTSLDTIAGSMVIGLIVATLKSPEWGMAVIGMNAQQFAECDLELDWYENVEVAGEIHYDTD